MLFLLRLEVEFWKMEIDQIDNQHTVEIFISLIAKGMEVWKMQSEIATDYDNFGLRNLPFQTTDNEQQNVSINITFLHS